MFRYFYWLGELKKIVIIDEANKVWSYELYREGDFINSDGSSCHYLLNSLLTGVMYYFVNGRGIEYIEELDKGTTPVTLR